MSNASVCPRPSRRSLRRAVSQADVRPSPQPGSDPSKALAPRGPGDLAEPMAGSLEDAQADARAIASFAAREDAEGRSVVGLQLGPFRIPLPKLPGSAGEGFRKRLGSIADQGRHMAIVTTAALPWMTGTSVNPLLRAAYLGQGGQRQVTLLVPWLAQSDQQRLFPNKMSFSTPAEQEAYIRRWVDNRVGFPTDFKIRFYPGRYAPEKCSILGVGDITSYIPDDEADIAILEEPEHLNWYHHGRRWTDKFKHVVGVCHTNYLDYARREEGGRAKAMLLGAINSLVCRQHCHKVIKLSGAVQPMPREVVEFVHGVSPSFLTVGDRKAQEAVSLRAAPAPDAPATSARDADASTVFPKGVYFIGKAIWAKGYTELLEHLAAHHRRTGDNIPLDVYGAGEDLEDIRARSQEFDLNLKFWGAKDHLDATIHDYKVFVNPSTSDVVATTTAEALAMGKFVVVPDLPCNKFFSTFSNCLVYRTPEEFSEKMKQALESEPKVRRYDGWPLMEWEGLGVDSRVHCQHLPTCCDLIASLALRSRCRGRRGTG